MAFNRLPVQTRQQIVYRETVTAIADGSRIHICESIALTGHLRNVPPAHQAIRTLTLPPDIEVHVCCIHNSEPSGPVGLTENILSGESRVGVAVILDRPRIKWEVTARCMSLGTDPRELKATTIIGVCRPIEEDRIEASEVQAMSGLSRACQEHVTRCLLYVRPLPEQHNIYAKWTTILSNWLARIRSRSTRNTLTSGRKT